MSIQRISIKGKNREMQTFTTLWFFFTIEKHLEHGVFFMVECRVVYHITSKNDQNLDRFIPQEKKSPKDAPQKYSFT